MSPRRLLIALAAAAAALAVFLGGVVVGGHPEATGLTQLREPLRGLLLGDSGETLPAQVLEALQERYYEDVDLERLERASVKQIIAALDDPYTAYLTPEELRALRDRNDGAYFGVGLQVAQRDRAIVVTRVFDDSPAARAGIGVGDRLVAVDGRSTAGRPLEAVVSEIRGPDGTTVTIGVDPAGGDGRRDVTLERARIRAPAVDGRVERLGGRRIGYVRLSQFTRGASAAVRAEVGRLGGEDVEALVLDLRGDPGGLVSEAVGVAGVFLPDGTPVVTTEGRNSPERTFRTQGDPAAPELPLVVLVDRGSASASEIVAGALRDADRARLVGDRTFGKALVQSTEILRDGGALKLTTARYLTPDGFDLSDRGLPPDVRALDDPDTEPDEALRRALREAVTGT